jgi:flagellar biosynthetic protein FliQ
LPITAANVGKVADMDAQDAINLTQQAMFTALLLGAPILLAGVLVGLLIGLAQALTQIQDQTVAFVPKIVAMVGILIVCLPWLVQKMVEYSEALITNIPKTILGG